MDSAHSRTDSRSPFEQLIERLELCKYAVQEAHYELEPPTDSEQKADLLIAVENLTSEVVDLLHTTKFIVWGELESDFKSKQDSEESEEE